MDTRNLLSGFKLNSSYLKWQDDLNRRETWDEACDRVFDMHNTLFDKIRQKNKKFNEYFNFALDSYKNKNILASMRSLQFGGDSILKHHGRMFNCLSGYCDRPVFFQECMYWLLCGCGVGFSVQKKHADKLPMIQKRSKDTKTFVIPDSIEGWADAIGVLMSSYFIGDVPHPEYQGKTVHFDYSEIRPYGAYISGGFKAAGSDGLRKSLIEIQNLLEGELKEGELKKMRTIVAYDVVMHMSDAVLSGGVRRSATICLFSPDDEEMLKAKTGNWYVENSQRARSNNSVVLLRDKTTKEQFANIMTSVKQWGEPAFVWSDSEDIIYNPCVEIGMYPQTENGVSGWQGCNLVEINGAKCETEEDFYNACKAAAIVGTMQAAYTDFRYVENSSKEIFDREALLGCSITGMMNKPDICFNEEIQRKGAEIIKEINKEVAEMIGVKQAARTTCVKPSGNASVTLGCASGIHGEHSPMYFRNVQMNKEDDVTKFFIKNNPNTYENSAWSKNNTDWVISFPVTSPEGSIYKTELEGVKQLEYVKLTQQNWVEYGTNEELCVNPRTRHNVSNTISVDDWDAVEEFIYTNRYWLAGVSLLSSSGDRDYVQAPFTAVYTPQQILDMYGDAQQFASGLIVDALYAFNNNLWDACDQFLGRGKYDLSQSNRHTWNKQGWINEAQQFSDRFFGGDKVKMTYCLKDVYNYHKWLKIKRTLKDIDWTTLNIKPDYVNVDTLGAISCAGGACEIQF